MSNYIMIAESGYTALVNPSGGRTLKDLQTLVGGFVDAVSLDINLDFNCDLWVNDEGLLNDYGYNAVASGLTGKYLVGPVVITALASNGETLGLTVTQVDQFAAYNIFPDTNNDNGWSVEDAARFFGVQLDNA
jgi:hypothetical protein